MRKITVFIILLLTLTACRSFQVQKTETAGTDIPPSGMPNPASVNCEQNGNKLEIHTATDGSQSGECIFPDGSSCDEWAYFRGECGPTGQDSPAPEITLDATTESSNGGKVGNIPGDNHASGGYMAPGTTEEISNWWGVIKGTEPGAEFDDYFERQDLGGIIYFGIDSLDPTVMCQIEELRNTGKIVHLYGTLFSNVPDYNGSQVQIDRIEVDG